MIKNLWLYYQELVKGKTLSYIEGSVSELGYWQDLLFFNFLFYCLPISFIAVIPGVYMAVKGGYTLIASVDVISLVLLTMITFLRQIPLKIRKLFIVIIFYVLAIFLINLLGYLGPGVFYLFAINILIALVFSKAYGYWSVLLNILILLCFALIIHFHLFNCPLNQQYTTGMWIAFSSNLTFLSIILVSLIDRIFQSLQDTINKKEQLQDRYKKIFDRSPQPMWIFDTETSHFLEVNQAAVFNYGYTCEEFLQMTITDICPKAETQECLNQEKEILNHEIVKHKKKNGEYIHVKVESNLLTYNGRPVGLVLATDITEQVNSELDVKNTNLKIKKSEASLRAIFESSIDGFVLLDEEFKVKAFNNKAKQYVLLNMTQSDFEAGHNIFDYVEKLKQSYFKSAIKKVYQGEIVEYDREYLRKGDAPQWIRYTLTPVYEDQFIKGCCITGRDVTIRKQYLQNLEDQNNTFRRISWMQSHLVRAPLARIMGLINLLQMSREKDYTETIDYILLSAHELDHIIMEITKESNLIMSKYPTSSDSSDS